MEPLMSQTDWRTSLIQILEGAPDREIILKIRAHVDNLPLAKSEKILLLTNTARELATKAIYAKAFSATLDSLASELLRPHAIR